MATTFRVIGIGATNKQEEVLITVPDGATIAGTILTTATQVADTDVASSYKTSRYDIALWTTTKSRHLSMTVSKDSSGIVDCVFAKSGSSIAANITAQINGSNVELVITNNELVTLNYQITKNKIP